MWRKNMPDPYGVQELKRIITEILWQRTYFKSIARQYAELLKSPTDPADRHAKLTVAHITHFLDSPSHSL